MKRFSIWQSAIGNRQSSGFTLVELPVVRKRGFTLVELLTVVAIIALLIGLVAGISSFSSRKSAASRAQADMEKIKIALEEYRAVYGRYPVNSTEDDSTALSEALWCRPQDEGRAPFLVMPGWTNPDEDYEILDPWGRDYRYLDGNNANHNRFKFGYDLWSLGPNAEDGSDDITNWSGN